MGGRSGGGGGTIGRLASRVGREYGGPAFAPARGRGRIETALHRDYPAGGSLEVRRSILREEDRGQEHGVTESRRERALIKQVMSIRQNIKDREARSDTK